MKISDRIASLLLPISAVFMEVFLAYPWFVWTGRWPTLHWERTPLSILSVICLVGGSFLATRFFSSRQWSSRLIQLAIVGLGLIVVFISIRIEYGNGVDLFSLSWFNYIGKIILDSFSNLSSIVLALPAAAFLWWRGMLIGRRRDYNYIRSNLIYGVGSFVVLGLLWWVTIEQTTFNMAASIGPYIVGFLFFGLAGTAFSNLRNIQIRMPQGETRQVSYGRWFPIVTSIVVTIIGLGGIVAMATSLDVAGFIKKLFGNLSGIYETLLYWLSFPLKYILTPFEWLARKFLEWLIKILGSKPLQPEGNQGQMDELPEIVPGITPENWLTIIKWALFIIVVVVVTVLIARSIEKNRRRRTETSTDYEETHESLWRWSNLFNGLLQFINMFFRRFFPRKLLTGNVQMGHSDGRQTEQTAATLRIRDIFKHLLKDALKAGIGRRLSETPLEYANRFNEKTADVSKEMDELTELYVEVRYGDAGVGSDKIEYANNLWHQIRERLNRLKTEQNLN